MTPKRPPASAPRSALYSPKHASGKCRTSPSRPAPMSFTRARKRWCRSLPSVPRNARRCAAVHPRPSTRCRRAGFCSCAGRRAMAAMNMAGTFSAASIASWRAAAARRLGLRTCSTIIRNSSARSRLKRRTRFGESIAMRASPRASPSGKARRVAGGAVLSGTFAFASGIDYADWLICGALLEETGKPPAFFDFLIRRADATLIDDWQVAGLGGTGSKSFVLDAVFVPAHRFQDHRHSDDGDGPGTAINRAAVFRTPRASVAALGFAALAVGIGQGFLANYLAHTGQRPGRGVPPREQGSTQLGLAKAAAQIDAASAFLDQAVDQWVRLLESGGALDAHEKLKARFQAAFIARMTLEAVEALFAAAGGHAIYSSSPLQRQLRDLIAVATHRGLYLDESAPAYGKSAFAQGRL